MKKIITILSVALAPFATQAQDTHTPYIDRDIFNVCATIAGVAMFMGFILALSRQFLDYRIKTKLSENALPESVISSLLQQEPQAGKLNAAKWALIFVGVGVACTIIYYTLPLGIHSLAILAFCLAASFGAYFLLLHKTKK